VYHREGWFFYCNALIEGPQKKTITKEMIILLIISLATIDSIISQPELDFAQVGICVLDLECDSVIYARNCRTLFIPASNMKIIATGAALCYLGPDFRFKTRLAMSGKIKRNKLDGDIILIGGGDPTFSTEHLEQFVSILDDTMIREITGDIILDDSYFSDERLPIGWAWHYLDARYAPEISALSVNKNCVAVQMKATQLGLPADVVLGPETDYVKLVNNMITKAGDDSIIIFRKPDANIVYVDGGIGRGHAREIQVAVKDPSLFTGYLFKERLTDVHIKNKGKIIKKKINLFSTTDTSKKVSVIDSVLSQPLIDILRETNNESVNLYAEALLKTLGAYYYGEGSFDRGIHILKRYLYKCGVDTAMVSLWDGSGLSRHNLISPYFLSLVLRYMYHTEYSELFYTLLPSSGEGTLEYRFKGFDEMMRAKTGTLHAVSCISGYLKVGEIDYCFSMMFNNFTSKTKKIEEIQEQIIRALVQHLEQK